jgi:hypothetical protein
VPLIATRLFTEYAIGRVQIYRPASVRNGIGIRSLLNDILLS